MHPIPDYDTCVPYVRMRVDVDTFMSAHFGFGWKAKMDDIFAVIAIRRSGRYIYMIGRFTGKREAAMTMARLAFSRIGHVESVKQSSILNYSRENLTDALCTIIIREKR
jgi:hypothetical protein